MTWIVDIFPNRVCLNSWNVRKWETVYFYENSTFFFKMHRLPLFRRKKKIADLVMLIKSVRNILFNWHFWAISELIPSAIFIITSFWSETTLKVVILKYVYLKYTWNYIFEKLVENRSRYEEQKCLYLLWLKWQRLTIVFFVFRFVYL